MSQKRHSDVKWPPKNKLNLKKQFNKLNPMNYECKRKLIKD